MIRGKRLSFDKHAAHAMAAERPAVREGDVERVLEQPDRDDGHRTLKWLKDRTIIVYYDETEDEIYVRTISATRDRLAP